MIRFSFSILFFLLLVYQSFAQENKADDVKAIPFMLGVSTIPSNDWGVNSMIGQRQWLKYDFNATSLTTYEGTITGKRVPFKLGVNAQFENNVVGKIHRIAGYLGSKRTALRIQGGNMQGDARWKGTDVSILPDSFPFKNKYVNIDLLYYPKKAGVFAYIGIGYTSMKLPLQLNTLITSGGKENQKYGVAIYDTCYRTQTYSFLFGFDNITTDVVKKTKKSRLGMFFATQDKFGVGSGVISRKAEKAAELMNPGRESVGRNHISGLVEYNLSLGLKWTNDFDRVRLIVAAGYEIGGAGFFVFGGAASKSTDLGYDPSFDYWRYGFVFKAYLLVFQ